MNPRTIYFFILFIISIQSVGQTSPFLNLIHNPIHNTPDLFPETYNQKGYKKLLDTLIRWEMTRSMYDWKFGSSLSQIKSLSRITNSDNGMAMFHYFEGIRRGLGDPLNAENDFLKALEYFEVQKDSSGILHTTMHMFRLSLNTTMLEIGDLSRYYDLYQKVLDIGSKAKNPLDKIIHLRNTILYDEYICGAKNVLYYQPEIEKGLNIIRTLNNKYDYYKFLMLNTIGIIHSKSIKYEESEQWHLQAFDIIQKYPSLELGMAAYRIAAMQYENKKYEESLCYLHICHAIEKKSRFNLAIIPNTEALAYIFRLMAQNYNKIGDLKNEEYFTKEYFIIYNLVLPKQRYRLYMKDMAALYKNEENIKIILENEKTQSNLNLLISIGLALLIMMIMYSKFISNANKNLQKEIRKRDFIYSLIGHDLSSPILAMDNTLNHIENKLNDQLTPSEKNYLFMLRSKVKGAHFLLLNLLHWYKSDNDLSDRNQNKQLSNVKKFIDQSVQHLYFQSNDKTISFINLCPEHIQFLLDEEKFKTILRNIIDNAIKHASCTEITVHSNMENNKLLITINDNGVGMNPELVHLFNQSNSLFDLNNSKVKIGLGMIFILEFAKKMNSQIKVQSNDKGTKYLWEINN